METTKSYMGYPDWIKNRRRISKVVALRRFQTWINDDERNRSAVAPIHVEYDEKTRIEPLIRLSCLGGALTAVVDERTLRCLENPADVQYHMVIQFYAEQFALFDPVNEVGSYDHVVQVFTWWQELLMLYGVNEQD